MTPLPAAAQDDAESTAKGMTVIQYVMKRLKENGVNDVFGVPGDFAYPILDGVLDDPDIAWRGNCNELNASYAAAMRKKGQRFSCTR